MRNLILTISCAAILSLCGCASGGGKQVIRGAAAGASHGAINKHVSDPIAEGAAHGALGSARNVRHQNVSARDAAEKAAEQDKK